MRKRARVRGLTPRQQTVERRQGAHDRRPRHVLAQDIDPFHQTAVACGFGNDDVRFSLGQDRKRVIKAGRPDLQSAVGKACEPAGESGFSPVVRSNQKYGGSLHVRLSFRNVAPPLAVGWRPSPNCFPVTDFSQTESATPTVGSSRRVAKDTALACGRLSSPERLRNRFVVGEGCAI